jgi:hypothetical protein
VLQITAQDVDEDVLQNPGPAPEVEFSSASEMPPPPKDESAAPEEQRTGDLDPHFVGLDDLDVDVDEIHHSESTNHLETRFHGRYWEGELLNLLRDTSQVMRCSPPACDPTHVMDVVKAFVFVFPYSTLHPPCTLWLLAQYRTKVLQQLFVDCTTQLAMHGYWSVIGASQMPALAKAKSTSFFVRFTESCRQLVPKPDVHKPQALSLIPLLLCTLRICAAVMVLAPLSKLARTQFFGGVINQIDGVVREVLDPANMFMNSLVVIDGLANAHGYRRHGSNRFVTRCGRCFVCMVVLCGNDQRTALPWTRSFRKACDLVAGMKSRLAKGCASCHHRCASVLPTGYTATLCLPVSMWTGQ